MNQQFICISIGGTGVKIAQEYWDLMLLKYQHNSEDSFRYFVETNKNQKLIPRGILIDTDYMDIQYILEHGKLKNRFNHNNVKYGKQDCADLFPYGRYTVGREILEDCLGIIRREVEKCDNFGGFYFIESTSGGTGSGLGNFIQEIVNDEHKNKIKINFDVWPEVKKCNNNVVGIYNTLLQTEKDTIKNDLQIIFQNKQVCQILQPNFNQINSYIANCINRTMEQDISKLMACIVPFQPLNYTFCSIGNLDVSQNSNQNESQMFQNLNSNDHQSINVDLKQGKHISSGLYFQGEKFAFQFRNETGIIFHLKNPKYSIILNNPNTIFKTNWFLNKIIYLIYKIILRSFKYYKAYLININPYINIELLHIGGLLFYQKKIIILKIRYTGIGIDNGMFSQASENLKILIKNYQEFAVQQ